MQIHRQSHPTCEPGKQADDPAGIVTAGLTTNTVVGPVPAGATTDSDDDFRRACPGGANDLLTIHSTFEQRTMAIEF